MAKSIFKYDSELYRHVDLAANMPGLRREYSRLRQIAQKRLTRLERAGYGDTEIYTDYEDVFKRTRGLTDEQIAEIMPDLYSFLNRQTSTVSGMKQYIARNINALHDSGYDFVNQYNFREWTRFLDDVKSDEDFRYNEELDDIKGASTAEQRAQMRASRIARIEQRFNEYLRYNYY